MPYLPSLGSISKAYGKDKCEEIKKANFVSIFFPNGTIHDLWKPKQTGSGAEWNLSPILEPLAPVKELVNVYQKLENYTCQQDHDDLQPSHSRLTAGFLTFTDSLTEDERKARGLDAQTIINDTSFDQILADKISCQSELHSLQLGLQTSQYFEDYRNATYCQNISWRGTSPLPPIISPRNLFNSLFGAQGDATQKILVDFLYKESKSFMNKLSKEDKVYFEEYFSTIEKVEKNILESESGKTCSTSRTIQEHYEIGYEGEAYERAKHADLMSDLIALAFQCDKTNIVTYMLDAGRSEFSYNHVEILDFTENGVVPTGKFATNLHSAQHEVERAHELASVNRWYVQLVADLCEKLQNVTYGDGTTAMDRSVIVCASSMKDGTHKAIDLPVFTVGNGNGSLKTDLSISLGAKDGGPESQRQVADLYATIANGVFGQKIDKLGTTKNPIKNVDEILNKQTD